MTVPTGFASPPTNPVELRSFPKAPPVDSMHRLSEFPDPWFFSSVKEPDALGGGRFDLCPPSGTCYLGESLDACLVEKLLRFSTKVVVAERLDELFHATVMVGSELLIADATAAKATGFGVNAEIHSTLDYLIPRRWAAAFHNAGFRGLRYRLRGDPTQTCAGRAVFGSAGVHQRAPRGLRTSSVTPLDRSDAESMLAARGVKVLAIPHQVPITTPEQQAD